MSNRHDTTTRLADRDTTGGAGPLPALLPSIYEELRRVARRAMRRERPGQTLQATALVHEAWLRLSSARGLKAEDRSHLVAIAARAMRQILVEHARARHAAKRGGHGERVTLDERLAPDMARPVDLLDLDAALEKLAALDAQAAHVVELRYFGGLSVEETADALGLSPATVKRRWTLARAFLLRELSPR